MVIFKYGVRLDDPCCFPLGFMYVHAKLKSEGHDVTIYNENLWPLPLADILKAEAVYMTGFEEFKPQIIELAAVCKDHNIHTVVGGALATFNTEEMKKYVDEVFVGEFDDISDNFVLDYDALGIAEYYNRNDIKHIGILTSRGCPHSCTFCAHTCKYRVRKLKDVEQELDIYINKYNPDFIIFNDNTLNATEQRFRLICDIMKRKNKMWSAAIRCDNMSETAIREAKDSGCSYFVVGVESFNQSKLDKMNKHLKVEDIYKTLDLLHKYKINYHGNLLIGFDFETYDDILEEFNNIQGYNLFPFVLQPFTGIKAKRAAMPQTFIDKLNSICTDYATLKGMSCYPTA